MKGRCSILLLCLAATTARSFAQDARFGVAVPLTITSGALDTGRAYADNPSAANFTAGFRALATPELKLGSHWYAYSAVQVHSTPFFYDEAYSADRNVETQVIQGYLGYARSWGRTSVEVKFGKLASAFGAFPLRYDDTSNALLDQPLLYNYLAIQPGQLPCPVATYNRWPGGGFYCDPGWNWGYGPAPITLYGLPGAEVDVAQGRWDARFQLTNSSPANPKAWFSSGQHPQWSSGAGFTIRQGFRVGFSAFRGPWLDNSVQPQLPPGSRPGDFPATGFGADLQWARGHWNVQGEWARLGFVYPNFRISPASTFGYVELKRNLSPRWYWACRANANLNNRPEDLTARSLTSFLPNRETYEVAAGFRPDRFQLLKVGYEWTRDHYGVRSNDNVLGIQLVTSIGSLVKAF